MKNYFVQKMADKKQDTKKPEIEKEYVIPLREKCRSVPRYKKANKAIKTIKEVLARHMKVYDRDLNKIRIDKYLNEMVWFRGIRKPPAKIKIKAIKEGETVRAELADMPDKLKFKKAREEKREKKAVEAGKKKKTEEKPEEKPEETKKEEEKKEEEKEKKAAVVEAGQKMEKAAAKKAKHATQTAGKMTKQKQLSEKHI